ncbi:ATP-binding cassette domain-containing protein [Teredinibacter turnerae]|uniref:ATP-binding cassette domain-containing protein n=1 Tax=Teredinibacter turnerae TaxID=2426 RepID=UPI00035E7948|nr:ATP-binding cassette domain-containing protein [Teredinibacter turnerae]
MAFLEIQHLWKEYGDQVVLEQLNKQVTKGDFITIVGASGCGKTTFLNLLLGTEQPSRGRITLNGAPLKPEPNAERGIVFQRYSVFPHLTALENVVIARELEKSPVLGRLFGKAKKAARAEAETLLNAVGLGHAKNKYPHELSGGMQQRLALAQSLIKKPAILLLDEPFGALDPGIRADMHNLVLQLWREHQLTIFMITHDLKEGFHLGTRLWVFDKDRYDPQAPGAFGAQITYDLDVSHKDRAQLEHIIHNHSQSTEEVQASLA